MSYELQYNIYIAAMHVFMFLFGAAVGSFLNVCIYRLPKGESLIKSNSHCMTCREYIKKRDLIPIVSWCLLRGKCRACGAPISPRYTVVESLNAVGWVLISLKLDLVGNMLYTILCCLVYSALLVVFFMDWDTQLISTYVVIFIGILAVPEYLLCTRSSGLDLKSHIIGIFAASVPLLIVFLVSKGKAMGLGDVYLMAAAGAFLGTAKVVTALALGVIIGSVAGLIIKKISGDSKFAFGPWLSIGILISMLWGFDIANFYMNFSGLGELLYGEGYVSRMPYFS
ncbi:MAG: prepilin peptidase [Oscillospiraceae bacterium]